MSLISLLPVHKICLVVCPAFDCQSAFLDISGVKISRGGRRESGSYYFLRTSTVECRSAEGHIFPVEADRDKQK